METRLRCPHCGHRFEETPNIDPLTNRTVDAYACPDCGKHIQERCSDPDCDCQQRLETRRPTNKISHSANGKEYEIVILWTQDGFRVRTYHNGKQIGVTYGATYETAVAFNLTGAQFTNTGALETLINLAKDDLDLGITK